MKYFKQKDEYDCGVACLKTILLNSKYKSLYKGYDTLIKELKTTEVFGTFPEDIENYFVRNKIDFSKKMDRDFSIVLVSYDKFLPSSNEDCGHYIFLDFIQNVVFDPYTGNTHELNFFKDYHMENVLGGDKRYNNIIFSI